MSNDTWIKSIESIEPRINELIQAMLDGSTIKPILSQNDRGTWAVRLEEDWSNVDDAGNYYSSLDLDERVKWATKELDKWPRVSRQSWDKWHFKSRQDAEKFLTLYSLIWASE